LQKKEVEEGEKEEQVRVEMKKLKEQIRLQNQERKFLLKKINMLKVFRHKYFFLNAL
jgi:hypothetical protein